MISDIGAESCEKPSDEALYREAVIAMEKGDESAKTRVAFYKLSGAGRVEIDPERAFDLLEERVKAGDGEATWMLGVCYEFGIGTEQDVGQAMLLYYDSRQAGNTVGEFLHHGWFGGRGNGEMIIKDDLCFYRL